MRMAKIRGMNRVVERVRGGKRRRVR